MSEVVDSRSMQYAVIAGLHTETGIERLVIAYPNEESLRDLIAASSIIAAGFSSPEEAAADSRPSVAPETSLRETQGNRGSLVHRVARFIISSYSEIAATIFVIFSSRNAVSAVLRMALGSSL